MKSFTSTARASSKMLSPTPYIFRLPTELLLEIMKLLWDSAVSEEERRNLKNSLSLVSKTIGMIFYKVSQQEVTIASREFYNYYIGRISELDRSHPMNTACKSLQFHVDRREPDSAAAWATRMEPLQMGFQWKALDYFNGKSFLSKGLFPNLTHLVINIHGSLTRDPYNALFPHFMPRTILTVHINYLTLTGNTYRRTPITYPSIPHKLKRLTVTGLRRYMTGLWYKVTIARLWESLFEVEELIVDGQVLPIGKDAPWSMDMNQACDMIESGCKGIGWNWYKERQWRPLDLHFPYYWDYENTHGGRQLPGIENDYMLRFFRTVRRWLKHIERLFSQLLHPDFPQVNRPIRRLKSFSHLQDSSTGGSGTEDKITLMPIRRTKSCTELTTTGYPYGLRVWHPKILEFYIRYKWMMSDSSVYETRLDETWEYAWEMI